MPAEKKVAFIYPNATEEDPQETIKLVEAAGGEIVADGDQADRERLDRDHQLVGRPQGDP